ncbi:polyribonucleotide nucleotidyltransferase [Brevibacillus fluminis]|uniref:Polyribonucleotide nucleotidyltransferase n=1 Tax=Brevibacillus fluminis TaxID=511487 RepID=A0A3M8DWY7_9BACL|nr:polyribonucleotide nucleotidyltransferase [Brevibacillus fluminis]RNB92638.1 polyribonucleotide nucleotidyltransferase [Brevibacillus fluminis]
MDVSVIDSPLFQLRQTMGINLLKTQQATQVAQATAMIQDMANATAGVAASAAAPHPTLGSKLDISI